MSLHVFITPAALALTTMARARVAARALLMVWERAVQRCSVASSRAAARRARSLIPRGGNKTDSRGI